LISKIEWKRPLGQALPGSAFDMPNLEHVLHKYRFKDMKQILDDLRKLSLKVLTTRAFTTTRTQFQ